MSRERGDADRSGFGADRLLWIVGIEDTCVVPPPDSPLGPLDEYDLTEHATHWREDLERARDLGADALRYGVRWPAVHLAPGVFDWSELDERLPYAVRSLGLTVIADLVHYGAPTWLPESFADDRYPTAIAEFAGAFAARYRGLVDHLTPLNEPLTTASFCGLRGVWPPARTGWTGWTEVTLGIVAGIRSSIAAIRAANPDAAIVHVEASALYGAGPDLEDHAELLRQIAALPTDLLLGRVDENHPMLPWLKERGADPERLHAFTVGVPTVDLLGVNYYPDLTPRILVRIGTAIEQRTEDRWTAGLSECLRWFADRYGLPLVVTETSVEGDSARRERWVTASAAVVSRLRGQGMDIRGYTWWPLFDFVDWSWASGGRNVEEFLLDDDGTSGSAGQRYGDPSSGRGAFLRRMGLFALEEGSDGGLRRAATGAALVFRDLTGASEEVAETG